MAEATKYKKFFDLEAIVKNIRSYLPSFDKKLFLEAFDFAEQAHSGQFRRDGVTPYIVHPMAAVEILASLHADQDILISALLHDIPEDTKYDIHEIKHKFGNEISFLIDGITKLSKVHYQHNMPEREVESLKKMFLHTAKDPRVILVKLADRLHNMRTLQYIDKPEKRVRIATETLEIFVPIANLLGINIIKTELEDLCFKHLFPEEYEKLKIKVKDGNERNKTLMKKFTDIVKNSLSKHEINAEITPREKGLYRAYKRICSLGRTIDDMHDRISIKITVENIEECYQILGIIHSLFTPKTHSFEDYIANPKMNGYQSLHTIVFGLEGIETEVQIQTKEMSIESEYGIASCFFKGTSLSIDDKKAAWLMHVMAIEKEQKTGFDFLEDLKIDILQDRIFIFTPKGKTVDLPKGASVIDFAYAIHSDVGGHAVRAVINGETVPIVTILKTGDVVNVVTSPEAVPELYWLSFVRTNMAKNKILVFLRKISRHTKLEEGKKLLQKEFDIAGIGYFNDVPFRKIHDALTLTFNQDFLTPDDLYVAIGSGEVRPVNVLKALKNVDKKFNSILENKRRRGINVELRIKAKNRFGLLRDISSILYKHVIDLVSINAAVYHNSEMAYLKIEVLVSDIEDVSMIFEELEQFEDIYSVYRISSRGVILLLTVSTVALISWAVHPFILKYLLGTPHETYELMVDLFLFAGLAALVLMLLVLNSVVKRYFPPARDKHLFMISFSTAVIAILLLFFELEAFEFHSGGLFVAGFGIISALYLCISYFNLRRFK
ncbi:MAG: RelA/SpoT family protein [Candidatus Gracilibacteria bacterium]|jgi:RelA/SpoT family (p)ppGpp synthetase